MMYNYYIRYLGPSTIQMQPNHVSFVGVGIYTFNQRRSYGSNGLYGDLNMVVLF